MDTDSRPTLAARRVPPARLCHIVLRTAQYDELIAWWQEVLVAQIQHQNDFLSFMTYDDEHHRIAILRSPGMAGDSRKSAGLEHVAFAYDHLDDLLGTYLRLKAQGIGPVLTINHGMTFSMYFQDPDGNQAELQVDLCTPDEATAFMESDVFAKNPIGVLFDADEIVARRSAGESVEALTEYVPA